MSYYVGILDGSEGVWGVRIPDVAGCYGGGRTPEAAIADAISALREFAAHQATKGIELDPPRSVHDVLADRSAEFDASAGEAMVLVPLLLDQARPVKANVSLDAGLLEAIDEEAKRRGLTRSSFLTSAATDKIQQVADDQAATVRKLRLELAATHERLARQAAHFKKEMRHVGAQTQFMKETPYVANPRQAARKEERSSFAKRGQRPSAKRTPRGERKERTQ